jgi:glycine/D-amino acid oxidase-like deaminating enzyme
MGENPLDPVIGDETLPRKVDVVVIGGGIVGTSTALFLAEGGLKVLLCEKGRIGAEQSSRNWGWVRQMGRDPAELPLAIESLRLWEGMNARVGAETGFRRTGITYLIDSARVMTEYEDWLTHARQFGLPSRFLGRDELAAHLPGLACSFKGALYTESDGRGEPAMAAPAIAEAARRAGVGIATGCAVRGIERQAGRVCGVVTERGAVGCDAAVLAGGAWSRLFAGNLGIDFPQLKVLGTVARISAVEGVPQMPVGGGDFSFCKRLDGSFSVARRNATLAPIVPDSFRLFVDYLPSLVKTWREFRLRIGRRFVEEWRIPRHWRLDAISPFERVRVLDPAPIPSLNREGLHNLRRAFPAFAGARITQNWAGLIDVTPDATPVIGPVDAIPGFFLASGFSGHGFGIGPGAGKLMAELVMGRTPCVDPHFFRLNRFKRATSIGKTGANCRS